MKNEKGIEMTQEDILLEALNLLSDVCCLLFEGETPEIKAAAYMADSLLKYVQVIRHGDDILLAASDYSAYEDKIYQDKHVASNDSYHLGLGE